MNDLGTCVKDWVVRTENQGEESVIRAFTSLVKDLWAQLLHFPRIDLCMIIMWYQLFKDFTWHLVPGAEFAWVCSTPKIIQPTVGGAGFNFPRLQLSHGSRFSNLLRDIVHQPKLIYYFSSLLIISLSISIALNTPLTWNR